MTSTRPHPNHSAPAFSRCVQWLWHRVVFVVSDLYKGIMASPTVKNLQTNLAPTVSTLKTNLATSWSSVKEYAKDTLTETWGLDGVRDEELYGALMADAYRRAEQDLEQRALEAQYFQSRGADYSRNAELGEMRFPGRRTASLKQRSATSRAESVSLPGERLRPRANSETWSDKPAQAPLAGEGTTAVSQDTLDSSSLLPGGSTNSLGPAAFFNVAMEVEMCSLSKCSACSAMLYDEEIMAGWTADDSNLNTQCQFCSAKLVPFLQIYIKDFRQSSRPVMMTPSQSCESFQSIQSLPNSALPRQPPAQQPASVAAQPHLSSSSLNSTDSDKEGSVERPAEEKPAEERPAEETPAKERPAEEKSAKKALDFGAEKTADEAEDNTLDCKSMEDKSVEDKSVEDKSVDKSVEDKSVEDRSHEDKSVDEKSHVCKSVEDKPVEDKSVEDKSPGDKLVEDKSDTDTPMAEEGPSPMKQDLSSTGDETLSATTLSAETPDRTLQNEEEALPLDNCDSQAEAGSEAAKAEATGKEDEDKAIKTPKIEIGLESPERCLERAGRGRGESASMGDLLEDPTTNGSHVEAKDRKKYVDLEPISVAYLSPLVLRKEVENVMEQEGDLCLSRSQFMDEHPIIYWNLVWYFKRLDVNSHLNGFMLLSQCMNTEQPPKSWQKADSRHVHVRALWDNPRLHDELATPMYLLWNQAPTQIPPPLREQHIFAKGMMQQIVSSIMMNEVMPPIKSVMSERRKLRRLSSPRQPPLFSIYRDVLFLSFAALGRTNIDHNSFDKEYKNAIGYLNPRDQAKLKKFDLPPKVATVQCRTVFNELDL